MSDSATANKIAKRTGLKLKRIGTGRRAGRWTKVTVSVPIEEPKIVPT
jgi:hypothetical protein